MAKTKTITIEAEAAEAAAGRLTLIQRRKMGLTIANCARAAAKLRKAGTLSDDADVAAAQIAAELAGENPKAFQAAGADWGAILAFIERILPIILQLIALFGA
jgi:hypothetical protein